MASVIMANKSSMNVEKSEIVNKTNDKVEDKIESNEKVIERKKITTKTVSLKDKYNELANIVEELQEKKKTKSKPRMKPKVNTVKTDKIEKVEPVIKNEAEQKVITDVVIKEVEKEEKPILEEEKPILKNLEIKVENKDVPEPLPFENYKKETGVKTVKSRVNIQQVQNGVYNTKRIMPVLGRRNNPYNKW